MESVLSKSGILKQGNLFATSKSIWFEYPTSNSMKDLWNYDETDFSIIGKDQFLVYVKSESNNAFNPSIKNEELKNLENFIDEKQFKAFLTYNCYFLHCNSESSNKLVFKTIILSSDFKPGLTLDKRILYALKAYGIKKA